MTTKNFVVKNGLQVGNVTITAANSFIAASDANLGNLVTANFVAGTLTTNAQPNITSVGTLTDLSVTGNTTSGNVYANSGTIGANLLAGTLTTAAQPNITSVGNLSALEVSGNITTGGILTNNYYYANGQAVDFQQPGGSNTQVQFNDDGDLGGSANFTFNKTTSILTVSGNISATNTNAGNLLTANFVAGTLTTASQPNITSVGTLGNLSVSGNASAGNLNAGNLLTANFVAGTLTTASQPNITSVGNLSALEVTGNILTSANVVTDLIVGRTSGVTVTAAGSNQNINLVPTGTGIVDVSGKKLGNLATPTSDSDAATKLYVDEVAQGLDPKASVEYATAAALPAYTYNNGTSGIGATITANANGAFSIDGSTPSANARVLIKNETSTNQPYNGIYVVTTVGNGSAPFVLTRATDFDNAPGSEIPGAFVFVEAGSTNADTGWVCITNSPVTMGTTNIVFTQFAGAGTYTAGTGLTLTGTVFSISNTTVTAGSYGNGESVASFTVNDQGQLTAASNVSITANAANLIGTTLNSSVVTSSLTSVGTLGNLSVTGNTTSGNVYANSGTIGAANLTGTLTTNAQPNITSVGTLTDLSVTGNTTSGNVYANSGTIGANLLTGTLTTNAQPNITSVGTLASLSVSGNASAGNLNAGNLLTANFVAGTLTTASQPNITSIGTLANLSVTENITSGNVYANSGTIGAANLTGTLTTNAQTNITSVGTLTGLTIAANGNISLSGADSNITGANLVSGTYLAGTLTTAAQPNITSVGTLTSLTVSGNASANVVKLTSGLSSNRSNVSVTTNTVVDQFSAATYRTAKYIISASGDDGYQSVEALLVHDGTDAYVTVYGSVCSNVSADIVELSSNVNIGTGNVTVYATSNSSNAIVNIIASYIQT